jgi:hypothetical protein
VKDLALTKEERQFFVNVLKKHREDVKKLKEAVDKKLLVGTVHKDHFEVEAALVNNLMRRIVNDGKGNCVLCNLEVKYHGCEA